MYSHETTKKRRSRFGRILRLTILCVLILVWGTLLVEHLLPGAKVTRLANAQIPQWIDQQIIDIDGSSRRAEPLAAVRDIVIHYVGNPGTTAQQNHDYFEGDDSEVSSHFVIGLEGEIIQCIPLNEKSSASNWRNSDTISIEVCHPDESGEFTEATYDSLVRLTAWLCKTCSLSSDHIIRHYDITGKQCPLYYVKHESEWLQFKADVSDYRP